MYDSTPWPKRRTPSPPPPGYVPVSARRSFNTGAPRSTPPYITPAPTQTPIPQAKKTTWPPGVKLYVQRCFVPENLIAGISREEMETKLKETITQAAASNNLDSVDWTNLPLPQQLIQQARKKSLLGGGSSLPDPRSLSSFVPQTPAIKSSKKRKSGELTHPDKETPRSPPWRRAKDGFEGRVSFATQSDKRQRVMPPLHSNSKYQADLEQRKKRFENTKVHFRPVHPPTSSRVPGPIVGRCQDLEKNYYRLQDLPDPEIVRPLPVLRRTLDLIKFKWSQDKNYTYINDQFKSLRQDLTVQHIKNDFTVTVYEINARVALEQKDLGEFNQCQTQLRALYKQNLGGHPMEFTAYRIFYFIYTCNRTDMANLLAELTPADKADPAVAHALQVRSALALGSYHRFFKLYLQTPNMGAYMMDNFVVRERLAALASICKAYKPDVGIRFITDELSFDTDEESCNFILRYAGADVLCERESDGDARFLTGKVGQIFEQAKQQAFSLVDLKGQI